ncbi:MAG: hypothetical protein ACE5EG_12075 [Thermoanaerobaculia bacterium]
MANGVGRAVPRRWGVPGLFLIAIVAAAAAFIANAFFSEIHAGNTWSLVYGSGAAALLVMAVLYGARRRTMRVASRFRAGGAAGWLGLHIWGGSLFILLMLMHSGFRLPSGVITGWLWALSWWTVLSGIGGRMLQRWIPRMLSSGLGTEVLYERIAGLVEEIQDRAVRLAAGSHEAITTLYRALEPELAAPRRRWLFFVDITAGRERRGREFRHLRRLLGGEDRERLDQLEELYRTKLEIDAHYTLQQALRLWLYLHVPGSLLLVALLAAHLYSVWAY